MPTGWRATDPDPARGNNKLRIDFSPTIRYGRGQAWGFAPKGMMDCTNNGIMGLAASAQLVYVFREKA